MLSEELRQLLAAYVDGEVSSRQRKQVDRLLRKSAEARALLDQLQHDSGELRALKRQKLPQDFSLQLLKNIAEQKLHPAAPPVPSSPFPAWLGIGVAAAVLLLVTGGSFLFFSGLNRPPAKTFDTPRAANQESYNLLDLDADKTRLLGEVLARDKSQHLDLPCQDPARAVEELQVALNENGIQVMLPASARESLKNEAKVRYVLYAENVTPTEMAAILHKMGGDDRRARALGQRSAGFSPLFVHAISKEDRLDLSKLLGVDARQLQPGAGQALDLPIPMQADPAEKVGKGADTTRPGPAQKRPERYALILARAEGASADVAKSPEVQEFLRRRGRMRLGTLQVIVEIQPAMG